jgi:putative ABC transport system permease protein
MLWKKLFRTMRQYKAQFISMILMITIGVGIFVGFNMEWVSIDTNTKRFFKDSNFADYRIVSEEGFSEADVEKTESIKGVDKVSRYISVPTDIKERDGDSLALTVTENFDVSSFMKTAGADYDRKSEDGLWISDKYAAANDISIGDKLTLVYKGVSINTSVKGTVKSGEHLVCVRDETQLMPDYNTYGFGYISPAAYKKALGREYYPQLNIISELSKEDITDKADEVLGKTTLVLSKDENSSYSAADGEMEEGKTMGSVLPVLFLLIAVLTMVTTMHRLTAKEKVQIGTLKALGFRDRRILRHYTSYAFMIGIIGTVLGTGLGFLVAKMIMSRDGTMGTYFDMPYWSLKLPGFCLAILICLILALTLIGYLSVKGMLRGTAADSLRPYAPKKMKKLLLEKTALWNRFSFGTRWNLRDVMRHKSRTLMSLVGIVGCMVIVVGTMGMRDTMNAFLSIYYDDSMKYSSRIYLSETATEEDTRKL